MKDFLIPLVPKRVVTFDRMQVGLAVNQFFTLLDRIDILQWRELTLLVNVHIHTVGAGNTIYIYAAAQSVTPEDPTLDFIDRFGIDEWVTIESTTPSPAFLKHIIPTGGSTTNPFGDMLQIVAEANRTSANPISATISVTLSVKNA